MTPLRFRAWHEEKEEWQSYGFAIRYNGVILRGDGGIPTDELIIMQSTGLKDKNGKEIFEGDIVKFGCPWHCDTCGKDHTAQVTWSNGAFWLFNCGDWSEDADKTEIIGNIYENPDLIPSPSSL